MNTAPESASGTGSPDSSNPDFGSHFTARYWHRLDDGRFQCDLCPRLCKLHDGQRGACFVRMRAGDGMLLTTYGRSSGFCIDPIEKKPLNHFYPGSSILSFGTAGCNLACRFCQNWDISKSKDMDRLMDEASPEMIAAAAKRHGADAVAYTYNDPVIFAEYAMDTADACHALGVKTVAVTAGYMCDAPRREWTPPRTPRPEGDRPPRKEFGDRAPRPTGEKATKVMPSSRQVSSTAISGFRVHSEYSVCSAATGCSAWALRKVGAETSERPMLRIFPARTRSPSAPTLSSMGTCLSQRCR